MNPVTRYFRTLNAAIGNGWNRFWFTPSSATTLGLLRIAAGALALYAVATYAFDLERWFGEGGMFPMSLIGSFYRVSFPYLGQRSLLDVLPPSLLWPAYWLSLSVLALYTLGIGGRAMAIAAAAVTISFFARAPLVTGQFEVILSMLLIYLCIGRCTDALSIRSLWRKREIAPSNPQSAIPNPQSPSNTMSLRLIQIHIVLVHLMIGWAQLAVPDNVWWSGEGVWLAAARPGMSYLDTSLLINNPRLVAAWSHAMTLYLLTMPALIWIRLARPLLLVIGAVIWLAFALASGWVPFCLAMIAGLAAFIEPQASSPPQKSK